MAINVFDSFLKEFEQPITAFVSTSVSNLASYVDGPLRTAVMLYVILYGFAVMRGAISEPIMEFAWRAMRIVVVVLLATNSSAFQQYVTSLFFDSLPKEIGNALAGSGLNTSSGAPFDQLLSKGIDIANKIYEQAGLTNVAPALIAAILLVWDRFCSVPSSYTQKLVLASSSRSARSSLQWDYLRQRARLPKPGFGSSQTS